jgi:hypothetical protein
MSQAMRCRPATLLGVTDPLVAFYLDRACWSFASTVEREQETAVNRLPKNAKDAAHTRARQRILDQYLGVEEIPSDRFRSISK